MASVVFALFDDPERSRAAEASLLRAYGHGETAVQRFTRAPLDANVLPEGATEFGRNLVIAIASGAVFMALLGGVAGAMGIVPGLNTAWGIGLGLITGALMGLVGAMQAGTRVARQELRAIEPRLREGCVLLVLEVATRDEADAALETIRAHTPVVADACRGF